MIALLFPGQGSQATGMGRDLCERFETARFTFAEADRVLDFPISETCFDGPAGELSRTEIAQPALLTHSVAVLRVLQEEDFTWDAALGHSVGEYSALVATEALGFDDALRLVRTRGQTMAAAAAAAPGGMTAVLGLDAGAAEELCAGVEQAWPANHNCPGQVVVSGTEEGLAEVERRAAASGARRVVRLAVSGAFHSPLMQPAAEALRAPLAATPWGLPVRSFVSTCSAAFEAEELPGLLERQVVSPVRFEEAIRMLAGEGYNAYLEVGPGAVLTNLVKRIDDSAVTACAGDAASVEAALARGRLDA